MLEPIFAAVSCLALTPAVRKAAGGFNSPIKDDLPGHASKAGTCALGSVAIAASFALGSLISGGEATEALLVSLPFLAIGLADDCLKTFRHNADGFSSLAKLFLQLLASALMAWAARPYWTDVPGYVWWPLATIFTAATVNALNIADGLDGLAAKLSIPPFVLMAALCPELRDADMVIVAVLAAFLVYNSHPATIFMGDGGSHFLGALLSWNALASGRPLALVLACAPVYVEMLSSLVQIISIRLFGRKVFLIAPLHHHFERKGVPEEKITDRFFACAVLCSAAAWALSLPGAA